jgi:hypothetical protein
MSGYGIISEVSVVRLCRLSIGSNAIGASKQDLVWSELPDFGCIREKNFPNPFNVIWVVQMGIEKYFASLPGQITGLFRAIPCLSKRGVSRSSRTLGAGCGGRGCAIDEQRVRRTAKSCGPDAPALASSLQNHSQATVTIKPVTGESAKETVKTIAQGRPDCFR